MVANTDRKRHLVYVESSSLRAYLTELDTRVEQVAALIGAGNVNGGLVISVNGRSGNVTINKSDVALGNVDNTSDMNKPASTAVLALLAQKIGLDTFGQPDGVATLGADGKLNPSQLPAAMTGGLTYKGVWNASTNTPNIPNAAAGNKGWYYKVSAAGTTNINGISSWGVGDWVISNGDSWDRIDQNELVSSVNGQTGDVTITKAGIGLGNVDNTSDAAKPISTATQNALDNKQDTDERGQPNGYAPLDGDGKVPAAYLPATAGGEGQFVTSVQGQTGDIVLDASDVGAVDEDLLGANSGVATLDSSGKVPTSQLPEVLFGALNYQGTWNASTNTPAIPAAAAGNKGHYYMVSADGATNIGGITDWKIGDWIVSSGAAWQKVDNTDPSTAAFEIAANKGAANGYAPLGADSLVPWANLPKGSAGWNLQTASYALVLGDAGKTVGMNVGSANNLTVPLNTTVAFAIGDTIDIFQYGAGQTTIVATGGVTIRSSGGKLKLTGQYSGATLQKIGTNEWILVGDLSA